MRRQSKWPRIWLGGPMRGLRRSPWGCAKPLGYGKGQAAANRKLNIAFDSVTMLRPQDIPHGCKFDRSVRYPPAYSLRPLRRDFPSVAIKLPARGAAPDSLSARISVIVERAGGISKHVRPKASCRG